MQRPAHAGLRHVALNVLNMASMETFYMELLGFKEEWRPDQDNLYLCSGNDNLALHVVRDTGKKSQKLDHIGIVVDQLEDVDAWFAFLQAHQVEIVNPPKTHRDGARSFYCYDPEGTVVQIIFHPPISKGKPKKG